ncbi:AAA family ATPase [Spirulina sp. CCNP1310]|uniref:AAA family ATPase n=1 Tax=Spirulina sp. CCNP1310 TaxID=3110249 RepID=UPI002B213479|nr:AAA family ATPase [Spirulina sp. CCNP1310]MEA5418347.1 AAA family ATPase [Spirulina sp. CCNP1310]
MLDLDLLIRARYPLLYLVTPEEEPLLQALGEVAQQLVPQRQVLVWDLVRGWQDNGTHRNAVMGALGRVRTEEVEPTLFILKDLHFILQYPHNPANAPVIRELKNLAAELKYTHHTLILTSHTLILPSELAEEVTVIDFPLPDEGAIARILRDLVAPDQLHLNDLAQEQLIKACQGLSQTRIQRVLARALAAKGEINATDIESALAEKKQAIRQTGLLEFYAAEASLKSVGGLENLKQWVRLRKDAFTEEARRYGIPNPKGVLLVGIQGTGKSLSAKTIAHEWRLPLLRLDTGRLFGGLVGESESRVRRMIQVSEAIAPCVLWIDEIDKAFGNISGGVDGDSGTSRRMFGALITWMQEKTAPVFIVATANNVRILPAELLRKGRFDEIFFLNLPTEKERIAIFKVHLQRLRPTRLREFNLSLLAKQTKDFSGAEIEQVIFDAMHQAFAEGNEGQRRDFVDQDILRAIEETVPLSAIARDQIEDLKRWSAEVGARTASQDNELTQALRDYMKRRGFKPGGEL